MENPGATLEQAMRAVNELHALVEVARMAEAEVRGTRAYVPEPIDWMKGADGTPAIPANTPPEKWADYPADGFYRDYFQSTEFSTRVPAIVQEIAFAVSAIRSDFLNVTETGNGRIREMESASREARPRRFDARSMPIVFVSSENYGQSFERIQRDICKLKFAAPYFSLANLPVFTGPDGIESPVEFRQLRAMTNGVYIYPDNQSPDLGRLGFCHFVRAQVDALRAIDPVPNQVWGGLIGFARYGHRYLHNNWSTFSDSVFLQLTSGRYYAKFPEISGRAFFYLQLWELSRPPGADNLGLTLSDFWRTRFSTNRYSLVSIADSRSDFYSKYIGLADLAPTPPCPTDFPPNPPPPPPGGYPDSGDEFGDLGSTVAADAFVIFKPTLRRSLKDCQGCLECSCRRGDVECALSSVSVQIGLGGAGGRDDDPARLSIHSSIPSPELGSPESLIASVPESYEVLEKEGAVRQVRGPSLLADVVVETKARYHVRLYRDHGPVDSATGLYPPVGVPESTVTVELPDGTANANLFRVTSGNRNFEYVFDPGTGEWQLTQGFANGRRRETLQETRRDDARTTRRVVRGQDGRVLSEVQEIFRVLPWGEESVETVEGNGDAILRTTREFYDDAATHGANFGHPRRSTTSQGRWEFFREYDSDGEVLKRVEQFESNSYQESPLWPDPDNRSFETTRSPGLEMHAEYLRGKPVSRRWRRFASLGETWEIVATRAEVQDWGDPSNLVTRNESYLLTDSNGALAGERSRVLMPDGTITVYRYFSEEVDDPMFEGPGSPPLVRIRRTVIDSGEPDGAGASVMDGLREVVVEDANGNELSRESFDIASGERTGGEYVRHRDEAGRVTRVDSADGGTVTRDYDCCGISREVDSEGIVTTYNSDKVVRIDLDRDGIPELYYGRSVSRAGVTTHTLLDGLDRSFRTIVQGADGAMIVLDETEYDALGRVAARRDSAGGLTTESYGNVGNLDVQTTTYPDGTTRTSRRFEDGSPYEEVGSAVWGRRSRVDVIEDAGTWVVASTETVLDASGQETKEFVTTLLDFAGRSYKQMFPGPDGSGTATTTRSYDGRGRLIRERDRDGVTTLYGYDGKGERDTTVSDFDRNGVPDFGGRDRITRTVSWVTRSAARGRGVRKSDTFVWDREGNDLPSLVESVETTLDGREFWRTRHGRTSHGRTEVHRDLRRRTETETQIDGGRTVRVYEDGRVRTAVTYDTTGSPIKELRFAYDPLGRLVGMHESNKGDTIHTYGDDGRIRSITTPDPDPERAGPGFDPQTTRFEYFRDPVNGYGRTKTAPDGSKVHEVYHPSGALLRRWGGGVYPVAYTYDPSGRIRTQTTWQDFDSATGTSLGPGAVTTWEYNECGWLRSKRGADGQGSTLSYTPAGRLLRKTSARGIVSNYRYDNLGDLTNVTYTDGTPAVDVEYDRQGRRRRVADASGVREFEYEGDDVSSETFTGGLLAGHRSAKSHDGGGRSESLVVKAGDSSVYSVSHEYDSAGRPRKTVSGSKSATFRYSEDNGVSVETVFESGAMEVLKTVRRHDRLGRIVETVARPGVSSGIEARYAYDISGRRVRVHSGSGEYWSWQRDSLGQLTEATKYLSTSVPIPGFAFGYGFDSIGNRRSSRQENRIDVFEVNSVNEMTGMVAAPFAQVTGEAAEAARVTVNGLDAVRSGRHFYRELPIVRAKTAVSIEARLPGAGFAGTDAIAAQEGFLFRVPGRKVFSYDADGNLAEDDRWRYTWDAENRLVGVETSETAVGEGLRRRRIAFQYDSESRRVLRRAEVWDELADGWKIEVEEHYLYEGRNLILQWSPEDASARRAFVWGPDLSGVPNGVGGAGGLLFGTGSDGSAHCHASDGSGNVVLLVGAESGVVTGEFEYGPFGDLSRASGNAAAENPWRFGTKYADSITGLSDFGTRWYDPRRGRWLSRDPIGERGGLNQYAYCNNAPVDHVDVHGLYPGLPGHGDAIPPQTSSFLVRSLQGKADALLRSVYMGQAAFNPTRFRLVFMADRIGVGRNNRFVFTCKYGWIDHGHFLNNAVLAHSLPYSAGVVGSFLVELLQDAGGSNSAWSPEDLISNQLGREFGIELLAGTYLGFGSPADVAMEWDDFLRRAGAIRWESIGKTSVEEMVRRDQARFAKLPERAYSVAGGLAYKQSQQLWRCACNGDVPKPGLAY